MPYHKPQKIDLNSDYPCPCRRRGRLMLIVLTEAFGCNRCQQIFVVKEEGHALEQLAGHHPYKQVWRWTGYQWNRAYSNRDGYLPVAAIAVFVVPAIWLFLALQNPNSLIVPWAIVILLVVMLPALMVWMAYRR